MIATAAAILASVEATLADALALADASLVIFRCGVLVELKTQMLDPALPTRWKARAAGGRSDPSRGTIATSICRQ